MIETKAALSDEMTEREQRNRALARQAAADGIVVLENDGALPLEPQRIALFGAGATYTIQGGTGSGEVNVRREVTVLEGLEAAGFEIATRDWIERYDALWKAGKERFLADTRRGLLRLSLKSLGNIIAMEYRLPAGDMVSMQETDCADACIYVVSRQSGEGKDRTDEEGSFRLDATEIHSIRLCADKFDKFVLVINSAAHIDLSPLDGVDGVNAIVYMGQLGMEGGNALADVITGAVSPSGRLAVSWPKSYADVPFGDAYGIFAPDPDHAPYKEGVYVGYRYYDSFGVEPRYPFGHGLGYTTFALKAGRPKVEGTSASLEVVVSNAGEAPGREVVQAYVSCPHADGDGEYQRLVAFAKTGVLEAGQEEKLALSFGLADLASYDEDSAETYLAAGDYVLRVGTSSRDTKPAAILRVSERIVLSKHRNLCAAMSPVAELVAEPREEMIPKRLPVVKVDASAVEIVTYDYDLPEPRFSDEVEAHLDSFTADDLASFCAGTGLFGDKTRGFMVPGAVGHTTTDYLDRGIPNVELCDGPAGLRLQRRSGMGRKGNIRAIDASFSFYELVPGPAKRLMLANPDKTQVLYQFVTGFPVAAMVAQTWDVGLCEQIGRAVGEEMTEYGVSFWLAPAMNIVRNPLCGRNFEYYSEDPLISGKIAAAVTRGVQSWPGRYATVKHFAANNQEENRMHVSSDVDERVLREIYLRGFEIAVRESAPAAMMSAYNKINGTYCPNSHELSTDILRAEWGFAGLVMTDWLSTGKDRADEAGCVEAGVDLIMPGGKDVVKTLRRALAKGRLSSVAARRSAGRVLSAILGK